MVSAKQCHHHLDFPKTEKVKCEMECVFFRKEQRKKDHSLKNKNKK